VTFDEAVSVALALDGTALSTHYGQPAVKANGNAFLNTGHEPETSFVLHLDHGVIEWLLAAHPETFWQSAHYAGHPAILVRHDTAQGDLVREMIAAACDRARARPAPRPRNR
jgi:hypothetical protein